MTGSLRWRLLAGASLAIAAALTLAWLAMTLIFARHVEAQAVADLRRQAVVLVAGLSDAPAGLALDDEPADPRFASPASGFYWQLSAGRRQLRSRSLWDAALPPVPAPADHWRQSTVHGPFGQQLVVIARTIRPTVRSDAITAALAFDQASLAPARHAFGRDMAAFLLLLWAALSAAAWVQVSLGLRPLRTVRREIERLRRDPAARLGDGFPREVAPLAEAVDALVEARAEDVARARRRAADLAHSLKTPLAALAAQSRRARETGAAAAANGLDRAIRAAAAAIDAELARTRLGLIDGGACAAAPLVERLVGVIEHTGAGERVTIAVEVPPDLRLPLADADAAELIGPLLENAARHARRLVRVSGAMTGRATWLLVEDDGAGLDGARFEQAVLRGARLDTAGPGHGLGLAIARDLADASGGALTLAASALGGLAVTVWWSARFRPDAASHQTDAQRR